jgi:hypothetical protein
MTWLRRRMDDRIGVKLFDAFCDRETVSYIKLMVFEVAAGSQETTLIPPRITLRAKEIRTHVVVNAMDLPSKCIEIANHLRPD